MKTIKANFENNQFKVLFINQLEKKYSSKELISRNLDLYANLAQFDDLKFALEEINEEKNKQQQRLEQIFSYLNHTPAKQINLPIASTLSESFESINQFQPMSYTKDVAISFYSHLIESIECSSYRNLHYMSKQLSFTKISKLLDQNQDETKENCDLITNVEHENYKNYLSLKD